MALLLEQQEQQEEEEEQEEEEGGGGAKGVHKNAASTREGKGAAGSKGRRGVPGWLAAQQSACIVQDLSSDGSDG